MIPPQWRWKLPGLVSSRSCFFINEDNPSFDVYLLGDLPVFCQVSVKMLQVIFIFARIHYGFSCYTVTVGQARVALTFHPIPGSPVAFEILLFFHRLEMSSRCVSCLHRFLFQLSPRRNVQKTLPLWLCLSRGSPWESCLIRRQGHPVSHGFGFTSMSNLPDFNRITQVFKIKLCCRGLWDYRTRKIGCVTSH